jgi:hypothetical protein
MGCNSSSSLEEGGGARRLGDKLFQKRDKGVEDFGKELYRTIDRLLNTRAVKQNLKASYDDGLFHLCDIKATPSTRMFLDQSPVKEENKLVIKHLSSAKTSAGPIIEDITLVQYDQLEASVTKPMASLHAFGVHLYPLPTTNSYGVFLSWFKQHELPQQMQNGQHKYLLPRPLNAQVLNSTIVLGGLRPEPAPDEKASASVQMTVPNSQIEGGTSTNVGPRLGSI